MNDSYFDIKEGKIWIISSGFRVWQNATSETPVKQGEADEVVYSLWDFDIERPAFQEEEETCEVDPF